MKRLIKSWNLRWLTHKFTLVNWKLICRTVVISPNQVYNKISYCYSAQFIDHALFKFSVIIYLILQENVVALSLETGSTNTYNCNFFSVRSHDVWTRLVLPFQNIGLLYKIATMSLIFINIFTGHVWLFIELVKFQST